MNMNRQPGRELRVTLYAVKAARQLLHFPFTCVLPRRGGGLRVQFDWSPNQFLKQK